MQSTLVTAFNLSTFLIPCSFITWTEGKAECACFPDSSPGAVEKQSLRTSPENLQKSFLEIVCV